MKNNNKPMDAIQFLKLVDNNNKSFHKKNDFKEFLTLDLNVKNKHHVSATMLVLSRNKKQKYLLSPKQIMQICEKSDANVKDDDGWTYLHYILDYNYRQKLNLNNEQIIQLINKFDLTPMVFSGHSYFHYILMNNKIENLFLNNQQLCELYEKTIQAFDTKNMIYEKSTFIQHIKQQYSFFIPIYSSFKQLELLKINSTSKPPHQIKQKL